MLHLKYIVVIALAILLLTVFGIYFPAMFASLLGAVLLAYLLDPIVLWLEQRHISRPFSAFLLAFGVATFVLLLIAPALPDIFNQLLGLASEFPAVYDAKIAPFIESKTGQSMDWHQLLSHLPQGERAEMKFISSGVGGFLYISVYGLLFLMFLFIFLRDWEMIVASIRQFLHDLTPDEWNADIDLLLSRIGGSLSRLIRGQMEVSTILAIYYAIAFQIMGVLAEGNYTGFWGLVAALLTPGIWMLMGVVTGYLNLIPYLGVPIGGFITGLIGLVSFQFNAIWFYPVLLLVVTTAVMIDHKVLTPRVIGRSVHIHEIWVYLAIYVGFKTWGILGVVFALPMMAVISEVVKHTVCIWHEHREQERAQNSKASVAAQ